MLNGHTPTPYEDGSVLVYLKKLARWLDAQRVFGGTGVTVDQTNKGKTVSVNNELFPPWTFTKAGGRRVRMVRGKATTWFSAMPSGNRPTVFEVPVSGTVESPVDTLELPDNSTTEIWLESYVTSVNNNYGIISWELTDSDSGAPTDSIPFAVSSGAATPAGTFVPEDFNNAPTVGYDFDTIYTHLATVTTSGGEVTEIVQIMDGEISPRPPECMMSVMDQPDTGTTLYSLGTTIQEWDQLAIGAEGSLYVAGTSTGTSVLPEWLGPGAEDAYLRISGGKPSWQALTPTTVNVVVDVRDNSGSIEIKTRDIDVLSSGTASAWTPV